MMQRSGFRSRVGMAGGAGGAMLVLGALSVTAIGGGLAGCKSSHAEEVRANPTPDLDTLYQNDDDINNALTRTFDEDLRMFWQDLGRAFYVDRPSRLTREPVPVP